MIIYPILFKEFIALRVRMTEQRYLGSEVVLSSSLLLFLGFSFLVPWDALSRFFLFFISFPILLFLLFRGRVESDRILKGVVFVILATVLVNFVVGIPLERSLQSLRWGVTSLGFFVCVYISAKIWGGNGIKYGSLFFLIVILVSVFTIGFYIYNNNYPSRITGFGFMGHPIIGPGGLLVVWGVGMVLLLSGQAASWKNWMLSFISLFLVASLIFLSQSRGPLLSLLIFLVVTLVSIMLRVGTNSRVILKYAVIILGGLVIAL